LGGYGKIWGRVSPLAHSWRRHWPELSTFGQNEPTLQRDLSAVAKQLVSCFCQETTWMDLLYGARILAVFISFCHNAHVWQTDRQMSTDRPCVR